MNLTRSLSGCIATATLLLGLGLIGAGCRARAPAPPKDPGGALEPVDLVLVHTNDNWGETEPCGWPRAQDGGFRRRASFIKKERAAADHLLLLDTGDALIGGGRLGDATEGEAIVAGMNLMGYDAMALGPKELSLGPKILRQRMSEARFAVLSANAFFADTGQPVARPFTVVQIGGHRVGILGLTRLPEEPTPGFAVRDPQAQLVYWLPELRRQSETVILLTNVAYDQAMTIAAQVPVELVIAALPRAVPLRPVKAPGTDTLVLVAERPMPRHTGRYIGRLAATLTAAGKVENRGWEMVVLDASIPDDAAMSDLLAGFRQ